MNRFILAADPQDFPDLMCDEHVIKMITEEGQMLSSAIRQHMPNFASQHDAGLFNTSPNSGYSRHPCTRWAAHNKANFEWAIDLFFHMSVEYTCRFGTEHGTQTRLGGLLLLAITCDEYGVSFPTANLRHIHSVLVTCSKPARQPNGGLYKRTARTIATNNRRSKSLCVGRLNLNLHSCTRYQHETTYKTKPT